jgi:hypothetical protein
MASATSPPSAAAPASTPAAARALRAGLPALAAVQLVTGLMLALAPRAFFSAIADFGPRNLHDLRDMAAFYLASAIVLAIAAARPAWRAPALALVGLQYGLHALNHLLDIGRSDPGWVGPFDLASLAAGTLLVAALYREASR